MKTRRYGRSLATYIKSGRMAMSISGTGFKIAREDAASTNLCPLLCIFNGLILTTPHELCIRIFHFYSQIYHHWIICWKLQGYSARLKMSFFIMFPLRLNRVSVTETLTLFLSWCDIATNNRRILEDIEQIQHKIKRTIEWNKNQYLYSYNN